MKKSVTAILLALSLTSCAEVVDSLRDISQGTFLDKRLGSSQQATNGKSFYDYLVDFSNGKSSNYPISLETTNVIHFKTLNANTLIQSDEINYDHDFVELFSNELKSHNIKLKPSPADKKCKIPEGFLVQTYEFNVNKKKLYLIHSGIVCGSCLPNPLHITKKSPCDVINNISY